MKELIVKYLVEFGMETTKSSIYGVEFILPNVIDENNCYTPLPYNQIGIDNRRKLVEHYDEKLNHAKERLNYHTKRLTDSYRTKTILGIFKYKMDITDEIMSEIDLYSAFVDQYSVFLKTAEDDVSRSIINDKNEQDIRNAVIRFKNTHPKFK